MTIFEADWICPVSSTPVRNAALVVEGENISAVTARLPASEAGVVRFPGCAIIPGFVNAHSHIELTILRGFLENLPFVDWIRGLTHAKYRQLTRDELLLSARLGAAEMLLGGVTCLGEVMDIGTAWQAMKEFGFRGIAYQEVFGPRPELAPQQLDELRRKVSTLRSEETDTLRVGVSPHAPYTVSARLFEAVRDYSRRENLRLTIHAAESKEEGRFVRFGSGPLAESLAERGIEIEPAGVSPVSFLERLGLLGPETLLVHAIDLEDGDLEILAGRRAAIVHCPKSNAKFAHGTARVAEMLRMGLTIGLGTDSVASNNAVDMFEEMRSAIFQQRARTQQIGALDAQTAFRMATIGGAACLGLSSLLGSLEPGKRADFVVVDLNDVALQPVYDPIETMVYSASRHNVRSTYIGGEEARVDAREMIPQAAAIAARLRLDRNFKSSM